MTYRLDYFGPCQGTATGTGRVVNYGIPGWSAQGSLTGSSSCCANLQAQIGLQY